MNINQIRQNILDFNPHQIQNMAAQLWNQGFANVNTVWNNFGLLSREPVVTLLVDISPENRLYLQNEAKRELNAIKSEKRCEMNLNLPPNVVDMIDYNQMTITGTADNVRDAYLAIRQMLPIIVWFDLKLNTSLQSIILDPNVQPLQDIQKTYEITICVIPIQASVIQTTPSNHISIYIRTNKGKEENLKRGIEALSQFIESNNYGTIYPNLQTKIDVPSNRPEITGRTYSVLDTIGNKTSTQISVQRSATNLISNVSISGQDFSSIIIARTEINDRFVVELNFDITQLESKNMANFSRQLDRYCEEFAVHILMKPSVEPNKKTMIIRGNDKEVVKLFEVRQHILALIQNPSQPTQIKPFDHQIVTN